MTESGGSDGSTSFGAIADHARVAKQRTEVSKHIAQLSSPSSQAYSWLRFSDDLTKDDRKRAGEAVIANLAHKTPSTRREAAALIGTWKDRRAVLPLIELLGDKSADVRRYVVQALEEIRDPRAHAPLMALDPTPEPWLQRAIDACRPKGTAAVKNMRPPGDGPRGVPRAKPAPKAKRAATKR